MIFNSLEFAIFLPVVFLLYWLVFNKNLRAQNLFVVFASYYFYSCWDWRFTVLIAITSICSYLSGIWINNVRRSEEEPAKVQQVWYKNKELLITLGNVAVNLLILLFFKYCNFFIDSFVDAFSLFGKKLEINHLNIILPVGISFYTFQALSYSIDVYKKKIEPSHDIVAFFAFLSFFPQLTAGPIERAGNLLTQFCANRHFDYHSAVDGMRQMLWGLFKKIVVADGCGVCVDYIFKNSELLPKSTLLVGSALGLVQIYCDFSGYSDVAIGSSRLFGIHLNRNFNYPLFAISFSDYWKRAHISLTQWFMDYVYIPLIGNSTRLIYWNFCMIVTFLLSGLWHGSNWTFVVWGMCHGILIVFSMNTHKQQKRLEKRFHLKNVKWYLWIRRCFVLTVVALVGSLWQRTNIHDWLIDMKQIFSPAVFTYPGGATYGGKYIIFMILLFFIFEWIHRDKQHALELDNLKSKPLRWLIYVFIIVLIFNYGGVSAPFIYFQF
jgi:D-alanyl-lipoteichoic acid acyltransferase DltB (MBOAT superfamily)